MKPGRNDPCPCGSGKKYKKCCPGKFEASPTLQPPQQQAGIAAPGYPAAEKTPSQDALDQLITLFNAGRHAELESRARSLLDRYPDSGIVWKILGASLKVQGKDALASLRRATELLPDDAEAHSNLGNALKDLGQLDGAVASYRRALEIKPGFAEAHNNLGNTLRGLGRPDDAVASYRRALVAKPDYAEAHFNLGIVLQILVRLDEAAVSYRRALAIKPDFAEAHNNLGSVLQELWQLDGAVASCRRALEIKPDFANAHSNLGNILKEIGQLDEAVACYRRALSIKPDYADAHSNLLFCMDMMPAAGLPELQKERDRWDAAHAAPLWRDPAHANDRSPERRLRVGYVSGDFRNHSAARTLTGLLTRYDRSQFDVFAYSNFNGREDGITEQFRRGATFWRNISALTDEAAARMIREDRIDILVDLSGHSAGNRLLVFARKPAPIQITGWGYGTSTGMRAMDVFFTDPVVVPPEDKQYFTEEVRYLSGVAAPFLVEHYPDVNELPALPDGPVTFGSFNRLVKISDEAYRAWAEVLRATPGSRLMLKTAELNDAANRERVAGRFAEAGVAAERITMLGKTPWDEHVRAYNRVDIALDPFPHGGGVTTLEGLMMGVPAVTLRWPTIPGRVSASIMTTLGLTGWIAETPEQYVALAVRKAGDLPSLAALRRQLRGKVTSVIGDQDAYARDVEREYRYLWRRWCAGGSGKSDAGSFDASSQNIDHAMQRSGK